MKKIMFNDRYGLTQAVLDGRKTMTRRMIPQGFFLLTWDVRDDTLVYENDFGDFINIKKSIYAPYKVSEVVAVMQNYKDAGYTSDLLQEGICRRIGEHRSSDDYDIIGRKCDCFFDELAGWTNKMFVRADLMPHLIRITDVRVERLQDISDEDCLKEGIWKANNVGLNGITYWYPNLSNSTFRTPQEAFASLIDRISGKGTWERNPYVFAYEFELVR